MHLTIKDTNLNNFLNLYKNSEQSIIFSLEEDRNCDEVCKLKREKLGINKKVEI